MHWFGSLFTGSRAVLLVIGLSDDRLGEIDKPKLREKYCGEKLVERQNMS